jgi:cytidylate kinase
MFEFNTTFLWQDQMVLQHQLILDTEFCKKNKIVDKIKSKELVEIFEHYYGIDISDFGFKSFEIKHKQTNLKISLKGVEQLRQLQLRKLLK